MNRIQRYLSSAYHSLLSALLTLGLLTAQSALAATGSITPSASDQPAVSVSVLQFGTAHWALDQLKRRGFDHANGFDLDVHLVANLPASHLAVSSGNVDGAVADLLWAQARYEAGDPYVYLPFSSQIGDIVVPPDSPVQGVSDLPGLRIGVAGGPGSKGWVLLSRVAANRGIDLASVAEVQYAAPPLLSQALKRGQLDVLVTYWHFATRLRASGDARSAFGMANLLDAHPDMAMICVTHDAVDVSELANRLWYLDGEPATLQWDDALLADERTDGLVRQLQRLGESF